MDQKRASDPGEGPPREELDTDSVATNKIRQGVTGHNVRYVLFLSLAGVVLAFILAYLVVFGA